MNPIVFYADGTIQVTQNGRTYFAAGSSKELLRQLKSDWQIYF
ncbi:LAGLIDADG family homing endonuclease [Planococcus versutus]|nr:LAGLIDADG family homing endonuclease [Planococcus versutus]